MNLGHLQEALAIELLQGFSSGHISKLNTYVLVEGVFDFEDLETGFVVPSRLLVAIPQDWNKTSPAVCAKNDFLKYDLDWHVYQDLFLLKYPQWNSYSNGAICYVNPEEWGETQLRLSNKFHADEIVKCTAFWMKALITAFLQKHYFAHIKHIDQWPEEWAQWSHGEEGIEEYLNERKAS